MACSSMITRLAVAMAMAPPEPPSPMIAATLGTPMSRHISVERAIAFRPRNAEIVLEPAVGIGAFFVADDADAVAAEAAEAADDGLVLAVLAVAGERDEILDQRRHVIEAVRPLRMPRHLRLLPWVEPGIELLERLRGLAFDAV